MGGLENSVKLKSIQFTVRYRWVRSKIFYTFIFPTFILHPSLMLERERELQQPNAIVGAAIFSLRKGSMPRSSGPRRRRNGVATYFRSRNYKYSALT